MLVAVAELKSVPLTVTRVLLSSSPLVESVLAPLKPWLAMKRPKLIAEAVTVRCCKALPL